MPEEIRQPTVGQIREQETDVLYGLVLLFTYGQLALIVWDMLVMIPGFAGLTGLQDPGRVHSIGGITSMYLGLVGAYIGRNAWRKYKNKDDAEQVPQYMFLRIRRGYFYVAMWGTLCFVAYMLKAMTLISRMPYELVLTATGVMAELFGDKVLKGIVSRQTVQEIGQEIASADHHGR
jgi:uncharacterized membrane protein